MTEIISEKTVIVIPTYNEKENIEGLVGIIKQLYPLLRIIIVDDNSPDGTGIIADMLMAKHQGVSVIHHAQKVGIGPAYKDAFMYILADRYIEYIVTMDGDFSHDPYDLQRLFACIENNDLIIGSRYVIGGDIKDWSAKRRILSKYGNLYVRMIIGCRIRDMTAGFILYRRNILERVLENGIESNGYGFLIEMKYRAYMFGACIKEVPIVFRERKEGISKINKKIIGEGIVLPWRLRFQKNIL